MREWNGLTETAVAPGPIVPTTSRSKSTLLKRGHLPKSVLPDIAAMAARNAPLYQARSAGAAAKPSKNESVVELVNFFQTHEAPSPTPSAVPQVADANDMVKAGQRRFRLFGHRRKRSSDSKADDISLHLPNRQRGALTDANPKTSAPKRGSEKTLLHSHSLDSMRTNSKCEVERIGQPWLGDASEGKTEERKINRLSPLNLDQFSSMINISLGAGADSPSSSSPRQQSTQFGHSRHDSRSSAQHLSVIEEAPDSKNAGGKKPDSPASPTGLAVSSDQPSKTQQTKDQATTNANTSSPDSTQRSYSRPLKFFPEVPPSRGSSKSAMRASSGFSDISTVDSKKSPPSSPESKKRNRTPSGNSRPNIDPFPRPHSSAQTSTSQASDHDARSIRSASNDASSLDGKNSGRRASLPIESIVAFPLPAPKRPLPAVPSGPAGGGHHGRTKALSSRVTPANATPRDIRRLSHFSSQNRRGAAISHGRPFSTEPVCSEMAKAKLSGQENPGGSPQATSAESSSATLAKKVQDRAEKIHALKKKDVSTARSNSDATKSSEEALPEVAESPVLPQEKFTPKGQESQKKSPKLNVETGRRVPRTVASELPTPPPRSPLPPVPPVRGPTRDSLGQRYWSHTSVAMNQWGTSQLSRTDSTRSASACGMRCSKEKHDDTFESALPSSDDEGPGTTRSIRRRRGRTQATRKGADGATPSTAPESSKQRPDYDRPLTLRPPSRQNPVKSPPQSPRSDYTYRSRDSQTRLSCHSESVIQSLETRVAHLERQNKILQAALMATLDASGKAPTDGVAESFPGSRASSIMGRSVSSMASHSSTDDSTFSSKHRKSGRVKTSQGRDHWHAARDSSSFSSVESASGHGSAPGKEVEGMDYGWRSSVEETKTIQSF